MIADDRCEPPLLLDVLARLDPKLIVTSNYDRLMERALQAAGVDFLPVHQPVAGHDNAAQARNQRALAGWAGGPILYKIHGTFLDGDGDGDPMTWRPIVSEDDYIEFLTVAAIEDRGVPRLISGELADGTLLFLGYSLEDWTFRTIFKGLIESLPKTKQRRSFAIQLHPPDFWVRFWQSKGVEIYDMDLHDFADELARRAGVAL